MKSLYFSVIIPAYNVGAFIEETVESVLSQSFRDYEIIIINDGSTDDTPEKLSRFHDDRISVHHIENQGVSHARNLGISLAQGQYVAFLDGDDIWAPSHLQMAADYLQKHPETEWWSSRCYFGESLPESLRGSDAEVEHRSYYSLIGIGAYTCTFVILASLAKELLPLFPEHMSHAEDWAAWMSLAERQPPVAYIPIQDVLYRNREGSASRDISRPTTMLMKRFMAITHHMMALGKKRAGSPERELFFRIRAVERWIVFFAHLNPSCWAEELQRQKAILGVPLYLLVKLLASSFSFICRLVCKILSVTNRVLINKLKKSCR